MVIGMALSISFSRYEELGVQWLEKDLESPFGPEYLARAARHFERAEDIANRIDAIVFLQDEFDKPIFEPNSANDEKTNINEESESAICTEIGEYTERLRNVDVSKDEDSSDKKMTPKTAKACDKFAKFTFDSPPGADENN